MSSLSFPSRVDLRHALKGCVEIPLFLALGIQRFSPARHFALWSIAVPLVLLPVATLLSRDYAEGKGFLGSWLSFTVNTALSSALFLTCLYFILPIIEAPRTYFWRFISIYFWLNLAGLVINLPFLLMIKAGWYTWDDMLPLLACFLLYAYFYQGYAIARNFGTNIFLGIALSMIDMVCGNFIDGVMRSS